RHVTSRTYEAFCWEGRLDMLAFLGLPLPEMLEHTILLNPELTHCSFHREQQAGSQMVVHSWMELAQDRLHFYQEIRDSAQELVCKIATTYTVLREGESLSGQQIQELLDLSKAASADRQPAAFIASLPAISPGRPECKTVPTQLRVGYSDRTPFFDYQPGAFWRFIEEARWEFSTAIGLDQKRILEYDTVTFFTSGTFHIFRQPVAGEILRVETWIHRIEKIRCFLRSDVYDAEGNVVLCNIEEQLIVSLSRRRPRRAGPEFLHLVEEFIEVPPEQS
ncbi:MAG: hypothetical protein KDK33_19585, partial [Leptospiraceae bacterium]|nr:hypothetical protein [Leptospiraceae bacterium]